LRVAVERKRLPDALNDIVITSARPGKTISLTIRVDGNPALDVAGDGVIVATPTGSTAYARAAGGPILDPNLSSFLLVPICPTKPSISPLVLPLNTILEVELIMPGREALVIVDGEKEAQIKLGEKLRISRSEEPATFFVWREFYRKLKEKL
jgi:NAD+ kinase